MTLSRILRVIGATTVPDHVYYDEMLPIDGRKFETAKGEWRAKVIEWPIPAQDSSILCYTVDFHGPTVRLLKLWAAPEELHQGHPDAESHRERVMELVREWLQTHDGDGEIKAWDEPGIGQPQKSNVEQPATR